MTLAEIGFRFLMGGALVSVFAIVGQGFKPQTFSGLFGAAPSVAIATLGYTHAKHGTAYVLGECRSMIVGALAFTIYGLACIVLAKREHLHVWIAAALSWIAWLGVAAVGVGALLLAGNP